MFFPEEIHRRTCVVVAARHFVGRARGRGRQHRATPPEASPESERKSRTLSPSNTRWPAPGWRGYDSVPKSIPSTFGHHLFAKGSRTGTPPRGRPPGNRSRGDPAVSRAETDILSTYMRGARAGQRGDTFGTPFRRVTTQETPCLSKSVTFSTGLNYRGERLRGYIFPQSALCLFHSEVVFDVS